MKINRGFYRWIVRQNHNLLVLGAITFIFPELFIRSIYEHNTNRRLWGGKKACFTLSFDCDFPEDIQSLPNLLAMLGRYQIKASFACVGAWIEKYPKEHAMILTDGHEIINHTYSHPDNEILNPGRKFLYINRAEKKDEIEKCHEICIKILNYEPKGCRIPHFKTLFTNEIYSILKELGYKYSTSTWLTNTTSHGLPFEGSESIIEFPLSVCPKHPFTVFDTWHSLNAKRLSHKIIHRGPESYLDLFIKLVNIAIETGSYLNIYIDPLDVKKIPRFENMLKILSDEEILIESYEGYINRKLFIEK